MSLRGTRDNLGILDYLLYAGAPALVTYFLCGSQPDLKRSKNILLRDPGDCVQDELVSDSLRPRISDFPG